MLLFPNQKSAILLFHRVSTFHDTMWDPMDPSLFQECLKYVNRKFNVISLSELLFDRPIRSKKPFAAITFDDGYHDFLDFSIPILEKYNMPSTLFVVTDCIEKNIPTWTYSIDFAFKNSKRLKLTNFNFPQLPSKYQNTTWNNSEQRIAYGKQLKQYLKTINSEVRKKILESIFTEFSDIKVPTGMMLTWDELLDLKSPLVEIGSHTVTHQTLASIDDEIELKNEIELSRNILKEKLGSISQVLSYPCGSYTEKVKRITKEAGYLAGLAVKGRIYSSKVCDMFEVPRIELYNQSWTKTRMRINGTISLLDQLLQR